MAKPYDSEMRRLAETFAWANEVDIESLRCAVRVACGMPLRAVGSGGSLTCAYALVHLHQQMARQIGVVATPLDMAQLNVAPLSNWLLSAGGSNVDIMEAARKLAREEPRQLAILSGRPDSPLAKLGLSHPFIDLLLYRSPAGKDGFLATNSLLGFVSLLSRSYLEVFCRKNDWEIVRTKVAALLEMNSSQVESWSKGAKLLWSRGTTLVLHDANSRVGAIDLESKFTEAALGNLQVADFRNFAHGRHHWLAKWGDHSSVLALFSPSSAELVNRTLDLLPENVLVGRVALPDGPIAGMLGSLIASLKITGWVGIERGVDPGRPGVPDFGRKLYHLTLQRTTQKSAKDFSERLTAAIFRKSGTDIMDIECHGGLQYWRDAHNQFRQRILAAVYRTIVFDYDGTLVDTRQRFNVATPEISGHLRRLLESGIMLAIATGRGESVRRDLQKVLPENLWSKVMVGYYNGSELAALTDDDAPDNGKEMCKEIAEVGLLLSNQRILSTICIQVNRKHQITLRARGGISNLHLWDIVQEIFLTQDIRNLNLTRSSHSIDICPPHVSKTRVVSEIRKRKGTDVILTIGDQGRWPGNDHALLGEPYSLSVDEVSSNPETCWNLGRPGQRGPLVTLEYLEALESCVGGVRFKKDSFL